MKMYKIAVLFFSIIIFSGCRTYPKDFTYRYKNTDTGLAQLIDINGYYIAQHGCDSALYSVFMFYPDGLFTIATTSHVSPELIDCLEKGGASNICKYPLWGIYRIEGNLIKTQVLRTEGHGCTIFRDYRILEDKNIVNISDYVQPEYTNLGYMANYPSFKDNPCSRIAKFHPLKSKRNQSECPLLKKKWFSISE